MANTDFSRRAGGVSPLVSGLRHRGAYAAPLAGAVLAAALLSATPARAAFAFGELVINPEPVPSGDSRHGYMEYAFSVTNKSAHQTHEVTLRIPRVTYNYRAHSLRSISRTAQVGPASTVRMALLQSAIPLGGQGLEVIVDGKAQREELPVSLHNDRGEWSGAYGGGAVFGGPPGGSGMPPFILVSRSVSPNLEGNAHKADEVPPPVPPGAKPAPGGAPPVPIVIGGGLTARGFQWYRAETPAAAWSTTWLGYSSYDGVVVPGAELGTVPPAVRSALEQYVECGGSLLIVGGWQVPASWECGKTVRGKLTTYYAGFGRCLVHRDADPQQWTPVDWREIVSSWSAAAGPLEHVRSVTGAHKAFPVVEDLSIPVRGLFILMMLFVVLIGPVNLYVLARKKRKLWLLATVPAISLITCLAVLGYMLVAEGWQSHSRTEGLTFLDETARRATTLGMAGFYSPLTPGEGLRFDADTELTPQLASSSGYARGDTIRTIDWTHDQHLASGWVTARVPAYFMLRKSESRRERLTVHRADDGTLSVVNGLGAGIDRLWLADRAGKIYTGAHIPAGAKGPLKLETEQARGTADSLRRLFNIDWAGHYVSLTHAPQNYLRPGCYLAALDGAPFIEEGLKDSTRQARSVVYGIMKEPVHAD